MVIHIMFLESKILVSGWKLIMDTSMVNACRRCHFSALLSNRNLTLPFYSDRKTGFFGAEHIWPELRPNVPITSFLQDYLEDCH